ncbi:MAG: hypothetical protein M3Z75_03860 [Actinomycetota bacterium]|nr:hypothetical protein [Actinomycetota bacterium]
MDVLTATHGHLSPGDGVVGDGLRDRPAADPIQAHAARTRAAEAVVGPVQHLPGTVGGVAAAARHELRLLGRIELAEFRHGTAEPDLACRDVDQAERNRPAKPPPVLRLDHEMGERTREGIDNYPPHLPADPITAACLGPDRELLRLRHTVLLSSRPLRGPCRGPHRLARR